MEAFKVGSTLEIRDLAGPRLLELAKLFDRVERSSAAVNKNLRMLGSQATGIRQAAAATRALQRDMLLAEKSAAKFSAGLGGVNAGKSVGALKSVHGEFQRATSSASGLNAELKGISAEVPGLRAAGNAIEAMARHLTAASLRAATLASHMQQVIVAGSAMPRMPAIPRSVAGTGTASGAANVRPPRGLGAGGWSLFGGRGGGGGNVVPPAPPAPGGGAMPPIPLGPRVPPSPPTPGGGASPPVPPAPRMPPAPGGGGGRGGGHSGGLHGGNAHIGSGGIGLGGVGLGLNAGLLAPLAAGYVGYAAVSAGAHAAGELQTEIARFQALGLGDQMNAEAVKFVRGMNTIGTSLTENMTLFKDAQTVFRDSGTLDHAKMVTPLLSDMKFAAEALYGKEGGAETEAKFMDMLRVIELRKGLNNPAEFKNQANMIFQVLSTSGGRVDATQYLNMIKTGGVAAKSLSNKAIYYELEPIIQEMGGNRVGTALMSSYSNLVLGRLAKTSAAELMRLDLLDKSGVVFNKMGSIKQIRPGALKGTDMLQSSPVDYLEKILLPAFTAKGITKESDVLREIGMIFSNRTASNLFSTIYQQLPTIRKGEEMSAKALNIDQGKAIGDKTYEGKQREFEAAWNTFKTVFGESVLPGATAVLTAGTAFFRQLSAFTASQDRGIAEVQAQPGFWSKVKATWNWANGNDKDTPNPVATPTSPNTTVHVPVHLDGRVIADVVSGHQARALSAPLGSGMFDPGMQQTPQTLKRW